MQEGARRPGRLTLVTFTPPMFVPAKVDSLATPPLRNPPRGALAWPGVGGRSRSGGHSGGRTCKISIPIRMPAPSFSLECGVGGEGRLPDIGWNRRNVCMFGRPSVRPPQLPFLPCSRSMCITTVTITALFLTATTSSQTVAFLLNFLQPTPGTRTRVLPFYFFP